MFPCADEIRPNAWQGDKWYDFYRPTPRREWGALVEKNNGLFELINVVRRQLRNTGQFIPADKIRETLLKMGYIVGDGGLYE